MHMMKSMIFVHCHKTMLYVTQISETCDIDFASLNNPYFPSLSHFLHSCCFFKFFNLRTHSSLPPHIKDIVTTVVIELKVTWDADYINLIKNLPRKSTRLVLYIKFIENQRIAIVKNGKAFRTTKGSTTSISPMSSMRIHQT